MSALSAGSLSASTTLFSKRPVFVCSDPCVTAANTYGCVCVLFLFLALCREGGPVHHQRQEHPGGGEAGRKCLQPQKCQWLAENLNCVSDHALCDWLCVSISCCRCSRWSTRRSLCTCRRETAWRPASGWRCWARSAAATRDASPPSTRPTTQLEPGSAAERPTAAPPAVSPARRESPSPQRHLLDGTHRGVLIGVPLCFSSVLANLQLDIDCDRETERIFSLLSSNDAKLQKMEGECVFAITTCSPNTFYISLTSHWTHFQNVFFTLLTQCRAS